MDFLERQFELAGKIGFQAATICGFEKVVKPKKKKKKVFRSTKTDELLGGENFFRQWNNLRFWKSRQTKKKRYFGKNFARLMDFQISF